MKAPGRRCAPSTGCGPAASTASPISATEYRTEVRDNPLCWLPKEVDNSNGGQVWITSDHFGPLSRQMLHTSYGTSTLFQVLKEEVGGQMQGGVVPLLKFDTGVCRARFYPERNALFLTGLRGCKPTPPRTPAFIAFATPAKRPMSLSA